MTIEQLIKPEQLHALEDLTADLYSIEAENHINEVSFGWQYKAPELTACTCKHCGDEFHAASFESHSFCSPECDDEFNNVPTEFYEYVSPFPSFLD